MPVSIGLYLAIVRFSPPEHDALILHDAHHGSNIAGDFFYNFVRRHAPAHQPLGDPTAFLITSIVARPLMTGENGGCCADRLINFFIIEPATMSEELSIWRKIEMMAVAFAAVAVPLIVGLVGHWYSQATKEREVQGKFVELAVGILRTPSTEETRHIKDWANEILDRYSGVPVSAKARGELINLGPIPMLGTNPTDSECMESLQHATELVNAGDRDGGLAYVKRSQELCGK